MTDINSQDQFYEYVERRLMALPISHRLAFCAAIAERLFLYYPRFSERCGWGDPRPLRAVLDRVWLQVKGAPISRELANSMLDEVALVWPDMDEFSDDGAWTACSVLESLFHFVTDVESNSFIDVSEQALDLTTGWIDGISGGYYVEEFPARRAKIWKSAEMQGEVRRQIELLEYLSSKPEIDDATIDYLRTQYTTPDFGS